MEMSKVLAKNIEGKQATKSWGKCNKNASRRNQQGGPVDQLNAWHKMQGIRPTRMSTFFRHGTRIFGSLVIKLIFEICATLTHLWGRLGDLKINMYNLGE